MITIRFTRPAKDLTIELASSQLLRRFAPALSALRRGDKIDDLPSFDELQEVTKTKDEVKPRSLNVVAANYHQRELANQSLERAIFEKTKLLPKGLWQLSKLTELHLINCALTEVPERLVNLGETLAYLKMTSNCLKSLPASLFFKLKKLKHLNVAQNELQVIPLEIVALKQLVSLDVSRNHLRKLPFTLAGLCHLKDLNVSNNLLEYLPACVMVRSASPNFRPVSADFSGNRSSHEFVGRLTSWPQVGDRQSVPTLLEKAASSALRLFRNLKLMDSWLPVTVYDYVQAKNNWCHTCNRPTCGPVIVDKVNWRYDWSSFAETIVSDGASSRLPVVHFKCWQCSMST